MAAFRCLRSGHTVSFTNENDIAGLRKHEGYEEIKDVETAQALQETEGREEEKRPLLKLRPPKVKE